MAKISSYPSDANVTVSDRLIGTDNENSNETKNFEIGDIIDLAETIITPNLINTYVPYTGANQNVNLGPNTLTVQNTVVLGDLNVTGSLRMDSNAGAAGTVLMSAGSGVTPVWYDLTSLFVPYTGANQNVNLGSNSFIALNGLFNGDLNVGGELLMDGNAGTAGQVLTSAGSGVTPQWVSPPVLYSATFFDTTTQNNGGATVANQVLINSTQSANGFTLGPDNRINVTNAGTYFFSANMQLSFTGGASNYNVTVWYTINDVIVPNSAFTFTTTGAQNDQTLATITDTIPLTAGQYLKFYWWSQATGMKLLATAAGTSPTRPLSPSVNVSIFNVG
jgi:hypothetical protein